MKTKSLLKTHIYFCSSGSNIFRLYWNMGSISWNYICSGISTEFCKLYRQQEFHKKETKLGAYQGYNYSYIRQDRGGTRWQRILRIVTTKTEIQKLKSCILGATSIEKIPKISASGWNFLDPPPLLEKGPQWRKCRYFLPNRNYKVWLFQNFNPPPISPESRTSPNLKLRWPLI